QMFVGVVIHGAGTVQAGELVPEPSQVQLQFTCTLHTPFLQPCPGDVLNVNHQIQGLHIKDVAGCGRADPRPRLHARDELPLEHVHEWRKLLLPTLAIHHDPHAPRPYQPCKTITHSVPSSYGSIRTLQSAQVRYSSTPP